MAVENTLTFVCDLCGAKREVVHQEDLRPGYELIGTAAPGSDWSWVHGRLVCPDHKIEVDPGHPEYWWVAQQNGIPCQAP